MNVRSLALTAAAAIVAIGGVFLLVQVSGSGASSSDHSVMTEPDTASPTTSPAGAGRARRDRTAAIVAPRRVGAAASADDGPPILPGRFSLNGIGSTPGATTARPDPMTPSAVDAETASAVQEINRLYDARDFGQARALAIKLLEHQAPTDRLMRVVVSSSCSLGDVDVAHKYWSEMSEPSRAQMTGLCERLGVTLE